MGPTTIGPNAITETNKPTTPGASHTASLVSPKAIPTIAMIPNTTPITSRLRDAPDRSTLTSRIAANGGTRPARRAGNVAQISVTTSPTMTVVINDCGSMTSDVSPVPKPTEFNNAVTPSASPRPPTKPS